MIDQVVGSYRLLSQLGSGGMGVVWLAEHTLLGRRVAIKFLHPEVSGNPAIVNRFFDEARAATRVADPGIVVVYDFGWHTDGSAFIVMEHLGGASVATRLRDGQFSIFETIRIVMQAALTMAVAHGSGIIHRDLKPDNIFLEPDQAIPGGVRVKILDFGIAKLVNDDHGNATRTRTGAIMGTPTYMSPEQCRGAGDVDHRTDIYALGCVLFHLLCGRLPFLATTPGDMLAAHLREPPPVPSTIVPEIPPTLDAIVARCLAKSADERYATMTELARDLAALTGSVSEIMTIPPVLATPRPSARSIEAVRRSGEYPHGAQLSTLASSAGETIVGPRRRRIFGAVVGVSVFAAIVTVVIVALSTRSTPVISTPGPQPIDARPAVDAPSLVQPMPDAVIAKPPVKPTPTTSPPIDAGVPVAPKDAAPRTIRPNRGSATPVPYDPYKDR